MEEYDTSEKADLSRLSSRVNTKELQEMNYSRLHRVAALIAIYLMGTTSCGGGDSIAGLTASGLIETGDFAITIGGGTTPTFSWPGGNAIAISVQAFPNGNSPSWSVGANNVGTGFASPTAYASVPTGSATLVSPTLPLQKGAHDLATILRVDQRSAQKEFIP